MKPLSKKKRSWYVILLVLAFLVIAPLLVLYASGYRLDQALHIATTGGIYISTSQSGDEIYLNNELIRTTSIFQKSVFVQNLKPGTYSVRVSKENYQDWNKTLFVYPETVTEARSFILPVNPITLEIPQTIRSTDPVEILNNPDYIAVNALFKTPKISPLMPKIATSTYDVKELRKLLVERVNNTLKVTWEGDLESIPAYFCQNEVCKDEIFIKPASKLGNFDFFPGRDDLIIMTLVDGIYVSEIDDRSPQNVQRLFGGTNLDFRIQNGDQIFLKKDSKYYSVEI